MLNRILQVKMVKPTVAKDENTTNPVLDHEVKLIHISEATQSIMRDGASLVFVYVVLDTARKVLIARATQ